ncbi:MAG: SDR family oxidoreductase [Flavobacteriaceae bacterium]
MNILLTGATGYIGKRLLPHLASSGHKVYCCVRDKNRFLVPKAFADQIEVLELDFLLPESLDQIPEDIDAAYFLMHSMTNSKNYMELELKVASNFVNALSKTRAKQVIYLSGIVNTEELSDHLGSRKAVEEALSKGSFHLTTLRAGIIIGSGSASFEIIRDLVEKLPLMIAPIWLKTKCQPIAIRDVLSFLTGVLNKPFTYDQNYDIGGPDVLDYKEMLLEFADVQGYNRSIYVVPVMTPKLSSYWLYFVTSTSYKLATSLVSSMKIEVICRPNNLAETLNIKPLSYREALIKTKAKIKDDDIISSWKDSMISGRFNIHLNDFIEVPTFGCFKDQRSISYANRDKTIEKLWAIGGQTGYYYGDWLWKLRGFMDRLQGGVGLRRGRTQLHEINNGDAIDFWRVLYSNKEQGRLLLFAEMKLPGEAWLEFRIQGKELIQTATFRPHGLAGRIYWYSVLPFHGFIFKNMLQNIAK